jgi:hypothetical protein
LPRCLLDSSINRTVSFESRGPAVFLRSNGRTTCFTCHMLHAGCWLTSGPHLAWRAHSLTVFLPRTLAIIQRYSINHLYLCLFLASVSSVHVRRPPASSLQPVSHRRTHAGPALFDLFNRDTCWLGLMFLLCLPFDGCCCLCHTSLLSMMRQQARRTEQERKSLKQNTSNRSTHNSVSDGIV